ncbi:MAG TPA: HDOD domain-containing protein [Thiobacillaceae bacterium]|nr:HDOD domain-containing protein [Thiobacillaceae bacterium]
MFKFATAFARRDATDRHDALEEAPRPEESAAESPLAHRFLTRQPILDPGNRIIGYELGVRGDVPLPVLPGASDEANIGDEYLITCVADLDFRRALGNRLVLLSLSTGTLDNPLLDTLARERTLLALQADELTPRIAERVAALADAGFIFVFDNYSGDIDQIGFLQHFEYARLDVTRLDALNLSHLALHLRNAGQVRLIAGNVENEEALDACRQLPFHLFQGHHFTQLRPAAPHKLDSNRMRVMDLLNMVMKHAELPKIEAAFKQDAALSIRLLRFMNSPALGIRHEIQSIGHALMMLGHDNLYRWLTFLLFSGDQGDARTLALFRTALTRARLLEILGQERLSPDQRGGLFLVGVLSILDALLNVPMAQALANLRLPQAVVSVLQANAGPYAPYLALARACERFDQDTVARWADQLGIPPDEINLAHVNALIWSESLEL